MAKRVKQFDKAKDARRRARIIQGSPPKTRLIPDKRFKKPKHKDKGE